MNDNHLVYSTDLGRIKPDNASKDNSLPSDGIIRIRRETKGRKGKGVTTVSGFNPISDDLKKIASELKKLCGTGGSLKDNVIEIQGENKEKIKLYLEKKGYKVKFTGG